MAEANQQTRPPIFLYTDGVTEATNAEVELYGEERLQKKETGLDMARAEAALKRAMARIGAAR